MSPPKCEVLLGKFYRGYLDQELFEKTKTKLGDLHWRHFRFLATHGVEGIMCETSPESTGQSITSEDSQKDELTKYQNKLIKEVQIWESYNHQLHVFTAVNKGRHLALRDEVMEKQKEAVETFQNLRFPVRSFTDAAHALTFAQACSYHWCDHVGVSSKLDTVQVFWCNCTILGARAQAGMTEAITNMIAPQLASNPGRSCAIVFGPNIGLWGNQFHEDEIRKHCDVVEEILQNPEHRLMYRRITMFSMIVVSLHTPLAQACTLAGLS